MLALLAIVILAPLLYVPGYLIAQALIGAAQPPDLLVRHYERTLAPAGAPLRAHAGRRAAERLAGADAG
jgi:hypothetical protein